MPKPNSTKTPPTNKDVHRVAKSAFRNNPFENLTVIPPKDVAQLNEELDKKLGGAVKAAMAKKVVPMTKGQMTGREAYENVRDYFDNVASGLSRGEYSILLAETACHIQCCIDCVAEEDSKGVE